MPSRSRPILPGEATPVPPERLGELIEALCRWGRLRVVVRHPLAVAELVADLGQARREPDGGLTVQTSDGEAHLALHEAAGAAFVVRPGHGQGLSRSVAFSDEHGQLFCQIYLWKTRADADYPPEQIAAFEQARASLGERAGRRSEGGG